MNQVVIVANSNSTVCLFSKLYSELARIVILNKVVLEIAEVIYFN